MSRFMTRLTTGIAAITLAALPGVVSAQDGTGGAGEVDKQTGPVAFANAGAFAIVDNGHGSPGGSVITETQRSPLLPGTSRLAQSRSELPDDDERQVVGPNYLVRLGEHEVTATLRDTQVPAGVAEADYVLEDVGSDTTVLEFRAARTAVECAAPDRLSSVATAQRLRLLDTDGALTPVDLPEGTEPVVRENVPLGPPYALDQPQVEATSDISIRRATALDQLLRQDQWRGGDHTAVAGWLIEIVTHPTPAEPSEEGESAARAGEIESTTDAGSGAAPRPAEGSGTGEAAQPSATPAATPSARTGETITRIVLGGVSCSLPQDFVALPGGDTGTATVPLKIPAGMPGPDAGMTEPGSLGRSTVAWGLGLVSGGAVLGVAALLVTRRRRSVPAQSADHAS